MEKKRKIGMVGVLLSLFLLATSGMAVITTADQPCLPNLFKGDVTLCGEAAPSGTVINAYINGELRGNTTVDTAGKYGVDYLYLAVNGESSDENADITFTVAGCNVDQTIKWHSYYEVPIRTLDLSAERECGDVDLNLGVNIGDVMYLAKHVAKIPGFETLHGDGNVDHNHEGLPNIGDVMYLAKYVAKIPGFENLNCI